MAARNRPFDAGQVAGLHAGDLKLTRSVVLNADYFALCEAFSDLLDGSRDVDRVLAATVVASWPDGRSSAADRRQRGRRTPASPSDYPSDPRARRSFISLSLDAVPRPALAHLFTLAFSLADGSAARRAAGRLLGSARPGVNSAREMLAGLVDDSNSQDGTAIEKLRLIPSYLQVLETVTSELAAQARASGATWVDIGQALGIRPDTARKRYGQSPAD